MRPRLMATILAGLAVGGMAAWMILSPPGPAMGPGKQTSGKALIGGPFTLVDHTGRKVTEKDFLGRKALVFFGYTSCPDICPSGLQVMSAALDSLGAKADGVTPIFISVDPERDTPQKLAEYVKSFHPRLIGLTGSQAEVDAAAKAYRVYFKKAPAPEGTKDYGVDHTSFFYLMDEKGEFVRHFTHPIEAAKLAAELAKSL